MTAGKGDKSLHLNFHGRIIDHLGIQMYQSPVAAVAEIISNAWDADAESVKVRLPEVLNSDAEIVILDNGNGMTFEECQNRFLEVGLNRRKGDPLARSTYKSRPVLGRKGIGKFAGFGIARVIKVDTVSRTNGERTVFILDADRLRGDEYIGSGEKEIEVLEYEGPSEERAETEHGTIIRLQKLTMVDRPSPKVFGKSMARRFLLHQRADDFEILINDESLPDSDGLEKIQFVFPRDYQDDGSRPNNLEIGADGWGTETVGEGRQIRWRFVFYEDTISEEELRGVAIFANGKLAQVPFDFNLVGGLGGQHGIEYLSGAVEADFIDEQAVDFIATERQRIDWNRLETRPLLLWGQSRIKELLRLWRDLRGKEKLDALTAKVEPFAQRLGNLPSHDRKIVERALWKLAGLSNLTAGSFRDVAEAVITAWEGGRLQDLISEISDADDLDPQKFLDLMLEAEVMTALHTGEAVMTKIRIINGLRQHIEKRTLENPLRDYIALHPWLVSPEWETFQREKSVENVILAAAKEAQIDKHDDWKGRIDLVLSSGTSLLILEFMRPGITVDIDHLSRFQAYVFSIKAHVHANTAGRFQVVVGGYLVADNLTKSAGVLGILESMRASGMKAMDWGTFLSNAEAQWQEFMGSLAERSPNDERLKSLVESSTAAAISSEQFDR